MYFPNTVLDPKVQQAASQHVVKPFSESDVVTTRNPLQTLAPVQPMTQGSVLKNPVYKPSFDVPQDNSTFSLYRPSTKPFTGAGSSNYGNGSQFSYDTLLAAIQNDTTGKYIGAVPTTKTYANYVEKNPEVTGSAPIEKQTAQPPKESNNTWQTALSAVQQSVAQLSKNQQNLARNEYNQEVADWEAQGKYWFDKNADLKPDLEAYMKDMPSSIDSLKEGSWVTSLQDGNTDTAGEWLSSVFINPAGGKTDNDVASAILNPLNIPEQAGWVDEGMVNYVGGKAAEGAMGGGFVGAIVGIIDGIFSWNSAKDEDKKRKAKAKAEYERKLKEWTFNRTSRLVAANAQKEEQLAKIRSQQREEEKQEKEAKKQEKVQSISSARQNMINSLLNAGSISSENRNSRLKRWS
jgi:hypothetical protein